MLYPRVLPRTPNAVLLAAVITEYFYSAFTLMALFACIVWSGYRLRLVGRAFARLRSLLLGCFFFLCVEHSGAIRLYGFLWRRDRETVDLLPPNDVEKRLSHVFGAVEFAEASVDDLNVFQQSRVVLVSYSSKFKGLAQDIPLLARLRPYLDGL